MSERSFIPEGMDQHISVGPFSARSRRLAIGSGAKTLSRPRWRADSLGPTAIGLRGRPDTYRRPGTCRWWVVVVHTLEEHRARRIGEKAFLTVVKESLPVPFHPSRRQGRARLASGGDNLRHSGSSRPRGISLMRPDYAALAAAVHKLISPSASSDPVRNWVPLRSHL
jgi:hypothetical protein